jgi:hypothetical protein
MDESGKRAIRLFGGRKTVTRADNGGLCEPEACREYQLRQCNLSGRFVFYIPGIESLDAFELATHSFYAMNAAIRRFEAIAFMRGGRISGFLDGRRATFHMTKKRIEVPRIDDEGKAVRVAQWIIDLEAPIDVSALLRPNEDDASLLAEAQAAASVLQGGDAGELEPTLTIEAGRAPGAEATHCAAPTTREAASRTPPQGPELDAVLAAVRDLGIDTQRFDTYASGRWGEGWKLNATGRKRALASIAQFAASPKAHADRGEGDPPIEGGPSP